MDESPGKPGCRALRKGRCSLVGQAYLITFVTAQRRAVFADPLLALSCCRAMVDSRHWQQAELLAWVLMPDHWHGLIVLGEQVKLSAQVARIKACSARAMDVDLARPVWARGFHDHALRKEEALIDAARYIVLNPVRAGLVSRCGSYPWWDAVWL